MLTDDIKQSDLFKRHSARLRSALAAHSADTICDFLTTHTKLLGQPFTFEGHEYQRKILEDPSKDIVIIKSAQIGISEMSARLALAKSALINGFSTIYTLPAASAAQNFMKTRIDPVIESSPYLSELVSGDVDNSSIKRLGDSYLYLKGAQVDRQAISVPADMLINDEVDNSNPGVLTLYESRLIHSKHGNTVKLSTPTIPDFGIDLLFQQSRQHINMCKCNHCNHWFYPDYFDHVRIPDFTDDLKAITKRHFASSSFRWSEAYVSCPKCGGKPSLLPEHREWVNANPDENFPAAGYKVSPFDCPTIILPSALVKASVTFERPQDYYNQRLGIAMADKETSLQRDELEKLLISIYPGGGFSFVMGLDMGSICWYTLGAVLPDQTLIVVKVVPIPLFEVAETVPRLYREDKVRMGVVDHGPYTETVYQLQQKLPNLFAGVYDNSKSLEFFRIKDQEKDKEKGKAVVRQVNISRDKAFDLIMGDIRTNKILKVMCQYDETWKDHLVSMKRVREFRDEELVFVWQKTDGNDHLHHSLLYMKVASNLLGVPAGMSYVPLPLVSTFKVNPQR